MSFKRFRSCPLYSSIMVINFIGAILAFTLGGLLVSAAWDIRSGCDTFIQAGIQGREEIPRLRSMSKLLIIMGGFVILVGFLLLVTSLDLFFLIFKPGNDKPILRAHNARLEYEMKLAANVHKCTVKRPKP